MSDVTKKRVIAGFIVFCVALMSVVVGLNIKGAMDSERLLEASIKSQMLSIANAADEIIDPAAFASYNGMEDVEGDPEYFETLARLRKLAKNTGAMYIYALKQMDGKYYFVFDTDEEDEGIFVEYDASPVHEEAFAGSPSAGVMNVVDEYGAFNTAAVPITGEAGEVLGVVAADTEDTYVAQYMKQFRRNIVLLVISVSAILVFFGFVIFRLLDRVKKTQNELEKLAHYDKLTDLPNRRYLMEHLAEVTGERRNMPFALFFIDLDNFKTVNDSAGHDAGDALLQHVGLYLSNAQDHDQKVFRTEAGNLSIAARVGGDEFVLVVADIDTVEEAAAFSEKLVDGFQSREIDKYIFRCGVGLSVGVSLYPSQTDNYHLLIKYADIAMYRAKRAGKNCYRVYNADMGEKQED